MILRESCGAGIKECINQLDFYPIFPSLSHFYTAIVDRAKELISWKIVFHFAVVKQWQPFIVCVRQRKQNQTRYALVFVCVGYKLCTVERASVDGFSFQYLPRLDAIEIPYRLKHDDFQEQTYNINCCCCCCKKNGIALFLGVLWWNTQINAHLPKFIDDENSRVFQNFGVNPVALRLLFHCIKNFHPPIKLVWHSLHARTQTEAKKWAKERERDRNGHGKRIMGTEKAE